MQDNPAIKAPPQDAPLPQQEASAAGGQRDVAAIRGATPLDALAARIEPGIALDPLLPADGTPPLWSRPRPGWMRLQRLGRQADAETIAAALATGASGFEIVVAGAANDYGDGLDPGALPALLAALQLDRCQLRVSASGTEALDAIDGAVRAGRHDPALLSIAFGIDPLGAIAAGRAEPQGWPAAAESLAALVGRLGASGHAGPFATADGRLVHAAGGTAAMELGYAVAALAALLGALLDGGIDEDLAVGAIDVALAADEDQFVTIAKFRAMRLLHARVLAAASLPRARLQLHGETSWRMLAAEDMQSNVIRASIAALSAGLGGADSLTVLSSLAPSSVVDADAERLALTTQAILIEEAHFGRVADPGAGSGTIAALTSALAEAAWLRFQAIERAGGLAGALASGRLQDEIAAAEAERTAEIAAGTRGIVGVTLFRADGAARRPEAATGDLEAGPALLRPRRSAAPFESTAS